MTTGWQNLTSERVRVRGRENILFEIRKLHAAAFETIVGDDFAYWLGTREAPELVGVAWKAEDTGASWWYACMNGIAIDMGVQCALLTLDGKNHVFPGSREQAEKQAAARVEATPVRMPVAKHQSLRLIFWGPWADKLTVRSANILLNEGISKIDDLRDKSETDLLRMPGMGRKCANEIIALAAAHDIQITPRPTREEGDVKLLRAIFGLTGSPGIPVTPSLQDGDVFREDGLWWKWSETATSARQLGPYPTRYKAVKAQSLEK